MSISKIKTAEQYRREDTATIFRPRFPTSIEIGDGADPVVDLGRVNADTAIYRRFLPTSLKGLVGWWDARTAYRHTHFQSNSVQATTDGDVVGMALDMSQGLVRGAELVTNGGFDTDTGWTLASGWTITNGVLRGTAATPTADQSISFVSGAVYEITYEIKNYTSGIVAFEVTGGTVVTFANRSSNGVFREVFQASSTNNAIRFNGDNASPFTGDIDNVSVKQVAGNHITQTTTANKPLLRTASGGYWEFDGVDDFYDFNGAGLDITRNKSALTFVMRIRPTNFSSVRPVFFARTGTGVTRLTIEMDATTGLLRVTGRRLDGDTIAGVTSSNISTSQDTVVTVAINYASANITIWHDGVQVVSSAFQTAGSTSDTASTSSRIGQTVGNYFIGRMGPLIILNRILSTQERQQLEAFV